MPELPTCLQQCEDERLSLVRFRKMLAGRFKHHSIQAQSTTNARHLQDSKDLVNELAVRVFSIQIDRVSQLLFVRDEAARNHLAAAQASWIGVG